jgi:Domain of unknown function (DUF4124)
MDKYTRRLGRFITAVLLLSTSGLAGAQYQWKEENGRMVYSDRPPPFGTPLANIIKVPDPKAKVTAPIAKPADSSSNAVTNAPKVVAAPSLADKDLESKKKALEQQKADQKKTQDAEQAAKVSQACKDGEASIRALESGARVAVTNEKGEREVMSDADKAKKLMGLKKDITDHCKAKG